MRWTIHIGAPKTGSTAIQRFLFDNRGLLAERDVLYPNVSLRGFGHHDLAFLLCGGYPEWATPQARPLEDLADDLRSETARADAGHVVISSENFFIYPDPPALKAVLETAGWRPADETRILVYVRRQDDAQASWYNQAVKAQGFSGSLDASLRRYADLWDYSARLKPWADAFGGDALTVRDYAPFAGAGLDIRRDFLQALGVAETGLTFPQGRVNERINRDILEFQRLINRLPVPTPTKRRFHKPLIELTALTSDRRVFDDRPLLSHAQARAVIETYETGNREIAERYLRRPRLFDPLEPSEGDEPGGGAPPGLTPRKIGYILAWLLAKRRP